MRSEKTPYTRKTFLTKWESRWYLSKLYLQETPLCHQMPNGYSQCCFPAWVCGKLLRKQALIKYTECCSDAAERVKLLIMRLGSTVLHCSVAEFCSPAHAGSQQCLNCRHVSEWCLWMLHQCPTQATGKEKRGICTLALFSSEGEESPGVNAVLGGFGWGRSAANSRWLRASQAGESCVDGDTALRPLR